jgi:hypothetical protein
MILSQELKQNRKETQLTFDTDLILLLLKKGLFSFSVAKFKQNVAEKFNQILLIIPHRTLI